METWKTRYCKVGQGSQCCKHLVTDGMAYACNRIVAQDSTFHPLPNASGEHCPGIRDFDAIEKSFAVTVENYQIVGLTLDGKEVSI